MTRMIRCIEGHVFDIDAQGKCPQCGWAPAVKSDAPAQTAKASPLAPVGALFGTLIAGVEKLLGMVGLRDKPGLAGGIVYAGVILIAVGGVLALSGAFRGSGNAPSVSTPANTPTNVNLQPQQKDVPRSPAPQQQAQPQQQPPQQQQGQSEQGGPGTQQQPAAPQQYQQRPNIHVPSEVRQLLRRIF
jgi:predicted lipid-binding transport protein (Tim44 family)